MTTDQKEASMSQEQQPEFVALIQQGIQLDQRVVSTGTDEAAIQSQAVAAATKLNSEQQGFGAAWTAVVLSVGSQEQQPEQSIGLSVMIDRCARERAEAYFGPEVNAEQIERVTRCEWDIFTYHAATGDDADCWCGAHVPVA